MSPMEADIRIFELIASSPFASHLGFFDLRTKVYKARKVSKAVERTILKWERIFRTLATNMEWWNLKSRFSIDLSTKERFQVWNSMLEMITAASLVEGILIEPGAKQP